MNYKLLMKLEQEENKILRSKIKTYKTHIASQEIEIEDLKVTAYESDRELDKLQTAIREATQNAKLALYNNTCEEFINSIDIKA